MNKRKQALLNQRAAALASAKGITTAADAAGLDLTAEQRTQFDAFMATVAQCDADIAREDLLIAAERNAGTSTVVGAGTGVESARDNAQDDPRHGFAHYGQFAMAVVQASRPGAQMDQRLLIGAAAPSTYGSEGVGQDGGFMVPPEFAREIFRHSLEEDAFLPDTDENPIQGNTMSFPRDETTPWGSDGVRAYWENEAGTATGTKPKGAVSTMRLGKLMALVPVTDELLQDALALNGYIGSKSSESIRWKTNEALFAGTGVGQPLGVFGHASAVTISKESGQAADTIVAGNVAKMLARLPAQSMRRAKWLINNDAFPQIMLMTIGNQPIWTPPNAGMKDAPLGLLLGRPLVINQHSKTVGDAGDIGLIDWKYYRTITKGNGIETATSMHLYFDAGLTAFRATFRVDGQPAIASSIAPANGSNNLSPIVFLEARA